MISDREFMDAAAKGLLVEARPFKKLADELGMTEGEVIDRIKKLIDEGKVRRFAASVRHQPIGYSENAMVIARVEPDRIEAVGAKASAIDAVSHCYQRAHPDGDPDCVYIMVHGAGNGEVARAVETISALPGVKSVEVCASIDELKKTSVSGISTNLDRLENGG